MRAFDKHLRVLTEVQRRAGKVISGGFKLVGADAFNAELHLLPLHLQLKQTQLQALTRLASSPL